MSGSVKSLCAGLTLWLALAAATAAQAPAPAPGPSAPAQGGPVPGRGGRGGTPTPPCGPAVTGTNIAKDSRCFELRTYTVQPESPGNIDVLHKRFREATIRLFTKHGMTVVGFWQPLTKPDTLIYILAYKDNAARDAAWAAFNADPEWVKARTEMNVRAQVDQIFMNATDYSALK